jgi:hypothetical protein
MDGTFDQGRPLKRANNWSCMYSLDLSSATDRLPIQIQQKLISNLLRDEQLSKDWVSLLVDRPYGLPKTANMDITHVKYAVGQPMGALSSWAMLALTHHFIVQAAAWRAGYPSNKLFTKYALLGDDLVLGDRKVAVQYLHILRCLGVECGLAKSLLSTNGWALEFAKRTVWKGVDVSPISMSEYVAAVSSVSGIISFQRKYNLTLAQICTVLGFGYKVKSWLNKPIGSLSQTLRAIKIASIIPTDPDGVIKLFSTGRPLSSEISDLVLAFIRQEYFTLKADISSVYTRLTTGALSSAPLFEGDPIELKYALEYIKFQINLKSKNLIYHNASTAMSMLSSGRSNDLTTAYLLYLTVLKTYSLLPVNLITLTLNRTPSIRGVHPYQLKM